MGTPIEVQLSDESYEVAKVVAKGWGTDGHTLVMVILEWADGTRQKVWDWPDLAWRPLAHNDGSPSSQDGAL
jgi:hypothetical protein